jgi:alkyl sulfatase BDS1-like metallo-beta-lactamase superfamily hydrolase
MKIRMTLTLALTVALCSGFGPTALAAGAGGVLADPGAVAGKHFDPKGKMPSKFTIELQNGFRKTLPFEDKRDFEEAKKGFIAAPPYKQIMAEAGNVAWDMGSYDFLLEGKDFDSVNPSLQRQAILNMAYGLYEVVPGKIYQVRGFDLANISFYQGRHRLDCV